MKYLFVCALLALSAHPAQAAELKIEPSTAFTDAYNVALGAIRLELKNERSEASGPSTVERFKNIANQVGDFEVALQMTNLGRGRPSAICKARVPIIRERLIQTSDRVLEIDAQNSMQTTARIERVVCQ